MRKRSSRRPAALKGDATRGQILNSAAHLFRDQGYSATTVREIAAKARITAGSIYYHFASKDEILLEVLNVGMRMVSDNVRLEVARLPANASVREKIATAVRGHLVGLLANGDFTSANIRIYEQVPQAIKKRHRVIRQEYGDYWDNLIAEAIASGEIRGDLPRSIIRLFIVGALNFTINWYNPEKGEIGNFADHINRMILSGLQPEATAGKHKLPTAWKMLREKA